MSPERWFKLAFGVAFVYAMTVAATTARRATRRHGGSVNQLEHEVRGLVALRAALGLVFYALLVPTLAFFTWSVRSLGTNYRGGVGLYPDHELVTTGAYRWLRHPIYVAFIAIMALVLVISANWILGLSGLALVTSIAALRVPTEERERRERFGDAWEQYARRTRWFLA